MPHIITESEIEQVSLEILSEMGYAVVNGPDVAPDGPSPERQSYSDILLISRLRNAIDRLNPKIPIEAKEEAIKQLLRSESPDLVINNRRFHKMLANGVDVEFRKDDRVVSDKVWLFDFENVSRNEFLAVNQYTIPEKRVKTPVFQRLSTRRFIRSFANFDTFQSTSGLILCARWYACANISRCG